MSRDNDDDLDDRPRRRRRDDDSDDDDLDDRPRRRRRPAGDEDAPNGLATTGLVLGIASLLFGFLAGIPAMICSAIAMNRPGKRGRATAGLVLGAVGTFVCVPVMIGLLLPAVQKVREAAARQAEVNNLKQIGLGQINYRSSTGGLPPADGPVSWRVHLLPYIEQDAVYRQFDTTQPWDSPQNRPLANTRIKTYLSPLDPSESADTRYRVFTGPGTLYEPGQPPLPLAKVTDGAANTIFAVDAAEAVPWPQPKELAITPNGPLPAVGHPSRNVVLVAMLDGSVRTVPKDKLTPELLRALISPAGGEAIPPDW